MFCRLKNQARSIEHLIVKGVFFIQDDNGPTANTTIEGGEKNTSSRRTGLSYALGRRKHNTSYVYGARSSAKKTR